MRPILTVALLLAASMSAQFACASECGMRSGGTINLSELIAKGVYCGGDLLQADGFATYSAKVYQSRWSQAYCAVDVSIALTRQTNPAIATQSGSSISRYGVSPVPVRGP